MCINPPSLTGVMVYTFNLSTQQSETDGSLSLRSISACSIYQVPGQLDPYSNTLSQKRKPGKKNCRDDHMACFYVFTLKIMCLIQ